MEPCSGTCFLPNASTFAINWFAYLAAANLVQRPKILRRHTMSALQVFLRFCHAHFGMQPATWRHLRLAAPSSCACASIGSIPNRLLTAGCLDRPRQDNRITRNLNGSAVSWRPKGTRELMTYTPEKPERWGKILLTLSHSADVGLPPRRTMTDEAALPAS